MTDANHWTINLTDKWKLENCYKQLCIISAPQSLRGLCFDWYLEIILIPHGQYDIFANSLILDKNFANSALLPSRNVREVVISGSQAVSKDCRDSVALEVTSKVKRSKA